MNLHRNFYGVYIQLSVARWLQQIKRRFIDNIENEAERMRILRL